jgi:hypothetical protein
MTVCLAGMGGQAALVLAVTGIFALGSLALRWFALAVGYRLGPDIVVLLGNPRWHRAIALAKRGGMAATGMVAGTYLARVWDLGPAGGGSPLWAGILVGFGLPLICRRRLPGEILVLVALVLALVLDFAF